MTFNKKGLGVVYACMNSLIHWVYTKCIKPLLFRHDPEWVHDRALIIGKRFGNSRIMRAILRAFFVRKYANLQQNIAGIDFALPVGLSAGFDKNGELLGVLPTLGFGFTQVGTVTLHSYEGNPPPRLYRLPQSKSIVVYYGLKNEGVLPIMDRVRASRTSIPLENFPISISIGKTNSNATCTEEAGITDYVSCLQMVQDSGQGDFYTLNISCPNTFGGEPFTTPERLEKLLAAIQEKSKPNKPLFIKMPINLPWEEFHKLLEVCDQHGVDGVIIGNLNKNHTDPTVKDSIPDHVRGGLSGLPTKELSNNLIAKTYAMYGKRFVIIGVGGVFTAKDAYEKIRLGASLIQLITGMIYEGPQLIATINQGIARLLERDGFSHISEAVGIDVQTKKVS
jgi:dihydroorotate dehydrogenase